LTQVLEELGMDLLNIKIINIKNNKIYYTVKLDSKGEGEFLEHNDDTHKTTAPDNYEYYKPDTIPYGEYTITEVKEGDNSEKESFFIQPESVGIKTQSELQSRIVEDTPVPVWLKVVKKDKTTNKVVGLAGAGFKLWDVKAGKFVVQNDMYNDISEVYTNADGYLYFPQKIYPGDYVLYETKAPEGYYLQDEYRLPENEADYGKVGGKKIHIDKIATGLKADAINPGKVEVGELEYEVDALNQPLYVNIKIVKTGEKLVSASQDTSEYNTTEGKKEVESLTPIWKSGIGLEGVKYKIYADEDIYTPDGVLRTKKGTLVDDVTTNSEGIAQSRYDLFPGKYKVVEYEVPKGYTLDTEPSYITVTNKDQYVKSATGTLEITDKRQHLSLTFNKIFEDPKYITGNEERHAVFGLYAKEDIKNYKGENAIPAGSLVEVLEVDGNGELKTTKDLPEGKYYVKEIYVSYPYGLSTQENEITLKYDGNPRNEEVKTKGTDVKNTIEYGKAIFVKISRSSEDNLIINGSFSDDTSKLDEKAKAMIEKIKTYATDEEIAKYYEDNGIICVPGATYEVWLDKDGKNKLTDSQTKEVVQFTTDKVGMIEIDDLPKNRTYYLKEVSAPEGYQVSETPVEFNINNSTSDAILYQAIYDESTKSEFIHKTDIFTGENVANCTFEITDKDGKVLLHSVTDNDGTAWIPQDIFKNGEKYYYTEISAPDVYYKDGKLYELNTEKHEFTAKIDEDGKWATEKIEVQNYRPTTDVKLIKTDEEDNVVPKCKFELKSEENGLFYETGVTDENGIYVFKNVPQGWYTYTELEAPEKYDLDTTPHRVYVTGDEMVIEFVNTGDIPVIALSIVAAVSVIGIVVLVIKKNKKNNNK